MLVILTQMGWGRGAGRPGKTEPGELDRAKDVLVILTQTGGGGGGGGGGVLWKTDTITAEVGQSNYGLTFTDLRTPEHRRLLFFLVCVC